MASSKICVLLIAAVICFTWVEANPTVKYDENGCGPNEYYDAHFSTCEPSCADRHPFICSRFGYTDCYCVDGYIRDANYECIKVENCPKIDNQAIIFPDD